MKRACFIILTTLLFLGLSSFKKENVNGAPDDASALHRTMKEITDVIVHDIYSPPVASRIYAYVSVAGYETAMQGDSNYISLAGQLHELTQLPQPEANKTYNYELASVHAMLIVAKALVISEERIENFHTALLQEYKYADSSQEVYENALAYGKEVAAHILAWAAKDRYKETRSLSKYAVLNDAASWKPTPPAYIKAIEPHWGKMRTFIIDSAQAFKPPPALPFSADNKSAFYKEAIAVYNAGTELSEEQKWIANFWDCNPFKMNVNGHVMYATKKISPGGHWVNITALACKKTSAGFVQSAEAYVCVSVALADAFISCWDEKYRSKVIRPETYINQYIDENWVPLLQTPPFPEYTSGHSVVSAASSVILTKIFGDHFDYEDATEVEFEIPARNFTSFRQAAEEAAISRFYGGIHYMPAINNGMIEGERLGKYITAQLKMRK